MEQQRTRSADSIIVWILSALLAAVFATTGIAKIIGAEPIAIQAAAMRGFPARIRTVGGLTELVGAAALLIPSVAGIAAALLALIMLPATLTQWISHQPGVLVPVVMFGLLLLIAWRRNPAAIRAGYHATVDTPRPLLREGLIAGAI